MKGILEFNLPGDQEDFDMAQNGCKWRSVVQELDNWLRDLVKHSEMNDEIKAAYQRARDELYLSVDEQGVTLWG